MLVNYLRHLDMLYINLNYRKTQVCRFFERENISLLFLFILELPTQTFIKKIYNNDKNFRISLIIMAAFAIPVLLAVIVGCIIRIRNRRKKIFRSFQFDY